jgi:hypothetical protein
VAVPSACVELVYLCGGTMASPCNTDLSAFPIGSSPGGRLRQGLVFLKRGSSALGPWSITPCWAASFHRGSGGKGLSALYGIDAKVDLVH